ncbi:hypothetical protein CRD60_00160 [Bifidobacterium aemilianum]|uniref:Endolytic murein transglycosylase n=1 Tax=Bifidobacterium aemilianum TaxID=2493120 RepID=A0A366K9D7_9BIFI|nr:endolytic transglycosylase MltG [Bifidobacterium aemilianum]RBP98336.1 hypothetical protein CRD60_00160 [Bifidobacterium aemilianum]
MAEAFDEFFNDQSQWVQPENGAATPPPRPPKSRREMRRNRKRQRTQRLLRIGLVFLLVLVVAAGGFGGYRVISNLVSSRHDSADIRDYPGPGTGRVQFTVKSGQGVQAIADNLAKMDVIKSAEVFASTVSANNSTLYPGTYTLKRHMSSLDVVNILSDQSKAKGFLEVRSGERVSEVIAHAARLSGLPESDFQSLVDAGGPGILPDEAQGKFEGWLEPGSYDVASVKSAEGILQSMVDKRVSRLDSLGVPRGQDRQRLLIEASVAESEVNSSEYYGKVVRVILNRLDRGMNLGMDTTVAYGLGIKADKLTDAMLADSSNPYNTRTNPGLPPSPISNPGDRAIQAAMDPPQGTWLYFVTTNLKTGETKFANTESEFETIRNEYKNSNKDAN